LQYNNATCYRDVGLILDAIIYDLTYGGNVKSRAAGKSYFVAGNPSAALVISQQKPETIDAINFATTVALTAVNQYSGAVTPQVALPTRGLTARQNAANQLIANRKFIQDEVIAYLSLTYPGFNYDEAKYRSDLDFILKAVTSDAVLGTNYLSRFSGLAFLRSYNVETTTAQKTELQAFLNKARDLSLAISQDSGMDTVLTENFAIITNIIDTLSSASAPVLSFTNTTNTSDPAYNGILYAKEQLIANRSFMINEVIAYINANLNPGSIQGYDETVCRRDTGYIIDAVTYDLLYGGNQATVNAVKAYFDNANVNTVYYEVTEVAAAFTRLRDFIRYIILADTVSWTKSVGNTSIQNTSGNPGSSTAGTTAYNLVQTVIDVLNLGIEDAPSVVEPTYLYGAYYTTRNTDRQSIIDGITSISNASIDYLDTNYATGFRYNQTTCRRDVGLIIDAVAYDVEYESNVQTRRAALKYYEGSTSANYVLSDQIIQTKAAIARARDVAALIVLESPVTRSTGNLTIQDTSGTPGVTGVDNTKVISLMNIIIDVLDNGVSAAPARDLGIRRSYQDPTDASYVPQSVNNTITSEVDVGLTITALMNQIAAIIQYGPEGPWVIAQQQVIDTLQSLVFPPTATSLQYGGILTGLNIPLKGETDPFTGLEITEDTIIRTVTQQFDNDGNVVSFKVKISAKILGTIPADTEITITGPGSDYIFDLNTALDARHQPGDVIGITTTFSTVRATGHDFLEVGTGGFDDSNYPHNVYGQANNPPTSSAIVKEVQPGRVFHVSTDQDGNFRVGSYFSVNQGDGSVTIAAKIGLSAVSSLSFLVGETVRQFSADSKLDDNSDNIVSTQKAIKTYINNLITGTFTVDNTRTPGKGLLQLAGDTISSNYMQGNLNMGYNKIEATVNSTDTQGFGVVNRKYVDNVFAGGTIDYSGSYSIATTGSRTNVLGFTMISDITNPGGVFINRGGIDLTNNRISNVKLPAYSGDAANKAYVDQAMATGGVRTGWQGFTLGNTNTRSTVSSVTITNNGSGYLNYVPVVQIVSASGTGAVATAVMEVSTVTITTPGTGYGGGDTITITTTGGSATFNVSTVGGTGAVTGLTILSRGTFTSLPTGTLQTVSSSGGFGLTVNLTFRVASITTVTGGYGYTDASVIIGGSVASVSISNPGSGYRATPTLSFSAPQTLGGVTAQGYAIMAGSGVNQEIASVVITNAGSGYTAPPVITQTHPGIAPTLAATIPAVLQSGSGATATVSLSALQKNINLNGNKVVSSADPVDNGDLVNLNYYKNNNFIGSISDVTITGTPSDADFLVFNGQTVPTGSKGSMVNVTLASGSNISASRSGNTLTLSIKSDAITNAMINSAAGISQSKLDLNRAAAVSSSVTPAATDYGVSVFDVSYFSSSNGFISLRNSTSSTTGISFEQVKQINNNVLLGRRNTLAGELSTGAIEELSPSVVRDLLGISATTVSALINDDTLSGQYGDGSVQYPFISVGLAARDTNKSGGQASYGALLRRGGVMIGPIVMSANSLPAGDSTINPYIRIPTVDTEKFDFGAAVGTTGSNGGRIRSIYSKSFIGDTHTGTTFGATSAPTTPGGSTATFNGTATYAGQAARVASSLSASSDFTLLNGTTAVTFNGSQTATLSIVASDVTTNSSIVRRTSSGNINANTFVGALNGNADTATAIKLGTTSYPGSTGSTATTTALRDGSGNLTAVNFIGVAQTAKYADVAERYLADADYEPGTVLEFGGEFEVTIAEDETRRIAGIVSTKPAYLMNSELDGKHVVELALLGRVPCKVRGKIRKGDMLVSGGDGYARPTSDPKLGTIIGKALENFDGIEGVIEVVVGRI
jgi:hypothetical protein